MSNNFERGQDVKKSLGVGLHKRLPTPGQKFFVRFRMRLSDPDYYALQRMEKKGIFQVATMLSSSNHHPEDLIKCTLDCLDDCSPYYAEWHPLEKIWVIE